MSIVYCIASKMQKPRRGVTIEAPGKYLEEVRNLGDTRRGAQPGGYSKRCATWGERPPNLNLEEVELQIIGLFLECDL